MNVGSALRDTLQRVARELELVLDVGGSDDLNTRLGSHTANVLFTEEVSELKDPISIIQKPDKKSNQSPSFCPEPYITSS